MSTLEQLHAAFDREYPVHNWDEECAGAAYFCCRQTGSVTRVYASATAARMASHIVSTDPATAPAGAFHFWSYPARINGVYLDWGHVAMSVGGGRGLMSNPEWNEWDWGICLGVTEIAAWTARRRGIVTYLGWSYTYGENTAVITGQVASESSRPFTAPDLEETPNMHAIRQINVPDSGVIIRDTAAPYSLTDQVFQAVVGGLGLKVTDVADWQYQTVIREQWAAHVADKAARGQGGQVNPLDPKQVADAVRDALKGSTFTVTAS